MCAKTEHNNLIQGAGLLTTDTFSNASGDIEIFAFSGNNRKDVKALLAKMLAETENADTPSDVVRLAEQSRAHFRSTDFFRLTMIVKQDDVLQGCLQNAIAAIDSKDGADSAVFPGIFFGEDKPPGKIAFLFPGQGSQYIHMGKDLIAFFPQAETVFKDVEVLFAREKPLHAYIYPEAPTDAADKKHMEELLRQTDIAQPAIGAISLVMAKILSVFEVFPGMTAGHSFGELTALCAGKRIRENDFLYLSVWRGRLMAAAGGADKGRMLAVKENPDTIAQRIQASGVDVILANKNSPEQGVLSGSSEEIEKIQQICKENRIRTMLLPVAAAFHSRLVSDAAEGFRQKIKSVEILTAAVPVYSNKTAMPYSEIEKEARHLFGEHLVSPVNFMDQIMNMHANGAGVFVELGPKNVLTGLVNSILKGFSFHAFSIDASSGKQNGVYDLAAALCRLGAIGCPVDLRPWKQPQI